MRARRRALNNLYWISIFIAGTLAWRDSLAAPVYDLSHTDGMNCFYGSAEAEKVLEAQGFVVANPDFRQIFEPYIHSDLPAFITPDSAWHTYHVILEEGVKEMERAQGARLAKFSRFLLTAAQDQSSNAPAEFSAIADYASLGLALQDHAHRESLSAAQKQFVEGLLAGTAPVESPIGFPLSPVQFRPQSFYTESAELKDFYAAHQWYACVDFRLSNERETLLALCVSWLIDTNPELLDLWNQLSNPYDSFVALPEDGTVASYSRTASALLGKQFGPTGFQTRLGDIRKRLETDTPAPRINDQSLSPRQYLEFQRTTKGFRLFPARQLPCAVCFQNTVEPKISGRMLPSGLDFMAASPVLQSPAALRALEKQFGKDIAQAVQKANCPPMPDSLYGRSMEVLAKLQERLPTSVPAPLRTEAWADVQLWTQLGAWAEQRHTWALYTKFGASTAGITISPPGVVAPYPKFFAGLANLARETAKTFEGTAAEKNFDAKSLATDLYEMEKLVRNNYNGMTKEELAKIRPKTAHYSRFFQTFYSKHFTEIQKDARKFHSDLDNRLKQIASGEQPSPEDREVLNLYFETRQFAPPQLRKFAEVCDKLAEFAKVQLAGNSLGHEEASWVRDYGKMIAHLQGYDADTWEDEFSIVTRIFNNQYDKSVFYAGVARPQALYIILPYKGKFQLYRGAVLTYREFSRPEGENLNDQSWREIVAKGKAPPPPIFTQSFLRNDKLMPSEKKRTTAEIKQPPPPPSKLAVQAVDLGPSPTQWVWHEGWITPSEDCKHVAYRARDGGKWRIFRDGVPGKEYDEARYQSFSPDSQHLAYLSRITNKWCIVLDGVDGPPFFQFNETTKEYWPFVFSPDSTRLAYVASNEKGKQYVVVDGVEGPLFDQVLHHSFSFCDDSKHYIYAARRERQGIVVKDGKEILKAEDVLSPVQSFGSTMIGSTFGPFLSSDGSRFACVIQRNGKWIAVVDGKESPPWDSISDLSLLGPSAGFSADGLHFTYVGDLGENHFVVLDEKINTNSWYYCAVFSPDSKHSAFVRATERAGASSATCLVLDGKPGKQFQGEIKNITFSPDGKKVAYKVGAWRADEFVVVHGGEEFDDYAADGDIVFSPDSHHLAFHGRKNAQSYFVVDGQPYLKSDDRYGGSLSSYFTFSPDSKRWGFISQHKDQKYAVICGVEYGPFYHLGIPDEEEYIYFSPDSRHFAFIATRQNSPRDYVGKEYLVVDGLEHEIDGRWLSGSVLRFDSATKLHGLVMGKERMTRLEAEIVKN